MDIILKILCSLYLGACMLHHSVVSNWTVAHLPDSSVPGVSQTRILEWVAMFQGIFLTQGLNLCLLCLLHW